MAATITIEILGCGDAFDVRFGTSASLVTASKDGQSVQLMFDCGYQTPVAYLAQQPPVDSLDALYVSHFHGDHVLGISILLAYFVYQGPRSRPFTIVGQPGVKRVVEQLCDIAHPRMLSAIPFELRFLETTEPVHVGPLELSFAQTIHGLPNFAARLTCGSSIAALSGDGQITKESRELYEGASVLVHEGYGWSGSYPKHQAVDELLEMLADSETLQTLVLVHCSGSERRKIAQRLVEQASRLPFKVQLALPGERFEVSSA
ncbi:MAG: hypothetical protein KDD69_12515 [Bdellovibrionales bacterium]|nr:hypothetical protein [Bdellovibrionales bacterium]